MEGLRFPNAPMRFGSFELDQHAGELSKDGTRVRLQEKPLQILRMLVEEPGKIITREELRQKIWPSDTFVDFDHGINNAVKRLRTALGDIAETPRYIETLPRRGYRFIGKIDRGLQFSFTGSSSFGKFVARSGAGVFRRRIDGSAHNHVGEDRSIAGCLAYLFDVV